MDPSETGDIVMRVQAHPLEKYQIKSNLVPNTIYYVSEFITVDQEERLIRNVQQAPKPKWTYLQNRSLQNWGGLPHPKGMIPEELPGWLKIYTEKLGKLDLFEGGKDPNHILMNRYEPGQGIMAHEDGPLFFPTVTTINTGSHTVLNFYRKSTDTESTDRQYAFSLLLWPRSLLVLRHEAYTSYLHEIEELHCDIIGRESKYLIANLECIPRDQLQQYQTSEGTCTIPRSTRYSFTIRYVPNVLKKLNLKKLIFTK